MAVTQNHDYHLVEPDPWPIIGAFAALALTGGAVLWFHENPYGTPIMVAGFAAVIVTMINWWANTIREAHEGYQTPVVQLHLRYGMILFIASEVMFFLAWFWAFYMATGFHGFHVLIGTIMLIVCLRRTYLGHFTPRQHFGFEAAAWYWHFVDVVWLFLFVSIYVWGGWGAPTHG